MQKKTTYQNLRNATKAVITGRCIAMNAYIKKKIAINSLTSLLKTPAKEELTKPKIS